MVPDEPETKTRIHTKRHESIKKRPLSQTEEAGFFYIREAIKA